MRKYIIAICITLCILFAGCSKVETVLDTPHRFVVEHSESSDPKYHIHIIKDTETNAQYLFVKNEYGYGLTRLVEGNE